MFTTKNQIYLYDTDAFGILYFPQQFRIVQEAYEAFLAHQGLPLKKLITECDFITVIVHCESDYKAPLVLGDELTVQVAPSRIGNSSFTLNYSLSHANKGEVGTAQTVHVTLDRITRKKIPLPSVLKGILKPTIPGPTANQIISELPSHLQKSSEVDF